MDAIALNMSNMSPGAALPLLGFTMILLPSLIGVNLVYASIIAFVFSIPQIVVYTILTQRIARTGGDYVWVSRTLGGLVGGVGSFTGYVMVTISYLAEIALACVFAIGSVGLTLGYQNFSVLAIPGSAPLLQFAVAAVIFVAFISVNIVKPKWGFRILSVLVVIGVVTILITLGVLLAGGTTGVVNYMASLGNANVTYTAVASSYSGPTFNWANTVFIMPYFAIFIYPWLNAAPAAASEIKNKNAIKWNVPVAAMIVFVLVTGAFAVLYYVAGFNFITAAFANSNLVFNYGLNIYTLAMGMSNNLAISWIIGVGWILWNIAVLGYGIITVSRYMLAQAFDRFLPSKIAYVSPRFGSPLIAHLLDLVVTVFLIGAIAEMYGVLSALYGTGIAGNAWFVIVGIAAAVYAMRKEQGPTKWVLFVSGLLMALVFAYYEYDWIVYSSVWGGNTLAYSYVGASFIGALIIYFGSKWYYKKQGIDVSLAYREIPPE